MTASLTNDDLLARLVGFDSVSGHSNRGLAEFICDYLDRPGVRITRVPSPDGTRLNLVIALGPEVADRSGLVLSGHMDTVPASEPGWQSDPFTLTRRGDTWVARGAADMKGFLALAMNRFAALEPDALRHPLVLLFTYDEELGAIGAGDLVRRWPEPEALPRAVIIGEPTSLRAVRAHKGHLKLRVELTGVPAHSAYPHLGRNAIEAGGRVVGALTELRRALEAERAPASVYFPEVPFPSLNIGTIRGGVAINVVPERCALELGIRLLPGMAAAAMVERVREVVARAAGDAPFTLEVINDTPAMLLADGAPIYRAVCREVHQHASHSVAFTTDGGWLQTIGMECVIFGPGSIEVAHRPNEFLPIDEFRRADALLESLVHRACVAGG
ncbi:MAG: acetylornithine deacetylase [Gemmatimonadota bacterium]